MTSAWLLPEHIADILPAQARHIEELRRQLLDVARAYGCELVMPPLLEHLSSLLSGAGQALNLRTFKLVDQLSGKTLGVRADTTPQVARIDAHLLNRSGVARLCYCGPVLHTRPASLYATREPLQFGAEVYGHGGLEADIEVLDLALDCLRLAGLKHLVLDLSDARILQGLLASDEPRRWTDEDIESWVLALAAKDTTALDTEVTPGATELASGLKALTRLYGDASVLDQARQALPDHPLIRQALQDLQTLIDHVRAAHPDVAVTLDLSEQGGHGYYTGARFAVYAQGADDALLRGGRYDEVGAVFGRKRPAVGFSLDLKEVAALVPARRMGAAIRAPWSEDVALRAAIRQLRLAGETVVCTLPGHEQEVQEFDCDRELVWQSGCWQVQACAVVSNES